MIQLNGTKFINYYDYLINNCKQYSQMQDFYHSRCNFHDNTINDFLICAGKNFVMEDFINGTFYLYPRAIDSVVRNNDYSNNKNYSFRITAYASLGRKGMPRVYNNKGIQTCITGTNCDAGWLTGKNTLSKRFLSKRNDLVTCSDQSVLLKCNIDSSNDIINNGYSSIFGGEMIQCKLTNINGYNYESSASNCYFKDVTRSYHRGHYFYNCYADNIVCGTSANATDETVIKYDNCILHNCQFGDGYWSTGKTIEIKNCIIINDSDLPIFNKTEYSTKYPITFENCYIECSNTSKEAAFYYYDNRSYNDDPTLDNYYVHGAMITFKNCTIKLNDNYLLRFDTHDSLGANIMNLTFTNNRIIGTHADEYFPAKTTHTNELNVHDSSNRDTDFELESYDIHVCKKSMEVGEENWLLIKPVPMNATNNNYTIEISNDNIEFADDNVLFKCLKQGETTITVTSIDNPEIKVSKTIKID